jgi:phosphoribosylaminoimidazolecarboxamide formyltransferase / IMP cyclohydrolase
VVKKLFNMLVVMPAQAGIQEHLSKELDSRLRGNDNLIGESMPRALLSVSDKTNIVEFAQGLHQLGWELIASGNTAKLLRDNRLPVTEVSDYTKSPEMLGGRVKTLHPAIHGGLLARATSEDHNELKKFGWDYIDLVAVNLYPFAKTVEKPDVDLAEVIENIDIGGVTLIRAAAKNYQRVILTCDPTDYLTILNKIKSNAIDLAMRKQLAVKGFALTAQYDQEINNYLITPHPAFGHPLPQGERVNLVLYPIQELRYGENPHQAATLYGFEPNTGPLGGKLIQGKPLSYNNLLDLDAAWRVVLSFAGPTICIVKHLSPCGIASDDDLTQAFAAALACDPVSAFGGIIASNQIIDEAMVLALGDLFVEAIVAPAFTEQALKLLAKRINCRVLEIKNKKLNNIEYRSIQNNFLKQELDQGDPKNSEWKVVTQRQPTEQEWQSLQFAWRVCQPVKSNAIVLAQGTAAIGIGGGQPNRIDCLRIAAERAGIKIKNSVLASDAFFPFADTVELAAQLGIAAIIQPGGAKRDAEVITAADKANIAMVFTGVRHFRH